MKVFRRNFAVLVILTANIMALLTSTQPVNAQRVVTVTADQPNIWTLEQAHYLLAQLHRRNLDLKASPLAALDANEINGINVDVLRTLLEAGATYNGADRFNNGLIKDDRTFDTARRRQLVGELDQLDTESTDLAKAIATLNREKDTTNDPEKRAALDAEITERTAQKAAVDRQIELTNTQLQGLSPASGNVTATQGPSGFNAGKFPSDLDDTFKKKAQDIISSFNTNPQLNASLKLDDYLQLQYEIISKQLTLLRDEVGPGEKLIFLELPQSINAPYGKSDHMWAQSRWKITGYTHCVVRVNGKPIPCAAILSPVGAERSRNRARKSSAGLLEALTPDTQQKYLLTLADVQDAEAFASRFISDHRDRFTENVSSQPSVSSLLAEYGQLKQDLLDAEKKFKNSKNLADECGRRVTSSCEKLEQEKEDLTKLRQKVRDPEPELLNGLLTILNGYIERDAQLNKDPKWNGINASTRTKLLSSVSADHATVRLFNRLWIEDIYPNELYRLNDSDFGIGDGTLEAGTSLRTIEILPRQSSLNVNDARIRNKSSALNFVASTLFGLGGNFSYQQQRERYSQFVQQELYSSGFGKGSREFGWTFTSMPGTDHLLSGNRTTYAIAVVPEDATSVKIESTGCAFDRKATQPADFDEAINPSWTGPAKNSCSNPRTFEIQIPGAGSDSDTDFDVTGMTYNPVKNGDTVVVAIYGRNFSSQIGVLINGVALPASIGIAQRFIRDDSTVGGSVLEETKLDKIKGSFERIDSGEILLAFQQADGQEGTPVITLVAPGKAINLNGISDLYINGVYRTSLKDSDFMFGKRAKSDLKVKDVQLFVSRSDKDGKPQELTALLAGSAFGIISNIFVNGIDSECASVAERNGARVCVPLGENYRIGESVYVLKFPPPKDETIKLVVASGDETMALDGLANPAAAKKPKDPPSSKPAELSFNVGAARPIFADSKHDKVTYLLVEITGIGLSSDLNISVGQLDVVDKGKAFITIPDPKPAQTIRLTDAKKNIYAEGVVTIPETAEPAASPSP